MTGSSLASVAGQQVSTGWWERLEDVVRPEFRVEVLMVAAGDPVMGYPECLVSGCTRPGSVRAMCTAHHQRWLAEGGPADIKHWVPTANPAIRGRTKLLFCLVTGCRRGVTASELCSAHREAWRRAGCPDRASWCATALPANDGKPPCVVHDCEVLAESTVLPLCRVHGYRWRNAGRPPLEEFSERCRTIGQLRFDFRGIPPLIRLELQYALQCKVDERKSKATPALFSPMLNEMRSTTASSILDRTADQWLAGMGRLSRAYCSFQALVRFIVRCLEDLRDGGGWDAEYPRDVWQLRRLNLAREHGNVSGSISFDDIPQPWLRDVAKRYLRMRLTAGLNVSSVQRHRQCIAMLAGFIHEQSPGSRSAAVLTRDMLERWMPHLGDPGGHVRTRIARLGATRVFLIAVRRHGWAPELPALTEVHPEDIPRRPALDARFLSEFVMNQLEDPATLAHIANPHFRLILQIIMGTGLRQGDARHLRFDCLVHDQQGAPYLRYTNRKMKREAIVPIDQALADLIAKQQQWVRARYPEPTVLFPRTSANLEGRFPFGQAALNHIVNDWLVACDIRDETGCPARVTPHQFRHTYATRLINKDVPLEVVRRLLDHSSMQMTAHYARMTDRTVREQWEKARKVDIHGQEVVLAADSPLADAAWMKHNLGRAKMALPSGYCGLPLQQTCPHANACLDCPVFVTTPEFLGQHRQQLVTTEQLIARARADGHFRMVEMNERVATNLHRIVTALEEQEQATHAS